MEIKELIDNLNSDLANEYKHWHFYINAASRVTGLHRKELKEFFLEQASSEMKHVTQFADMIVGLGGIPTIQINDFVSNLESPQGLLAEAWKMEKDVLENFYSRIKQAESIDSVDGRWIVIFMEGQIEDSRQDVDEISQMLK